MNLVSPDVSLSHETTDVGKGSSASEQIGLILDKPPLVVPDDLGGGTRLTQRWKHDAVHYRKARMPDHVIMTYYGDTGDHEIFVSGGAGNSQNITSRTRPGTITIIPSGHEAHWDIAGSFDDGVASILRTLLEITANDTDS
jgi:AraC family transcriptional regulator